MSNLSFIDPPSLRNRDHQPNKRTNQEASQPETEAARLLRSINAFPSSIEELANLPAELVGGNRLCGVGARHRKHSRLGYRGPQTAS